MKTNDELTLEFDALKKKYGTVYTLTVPMTDADDCDDFRTLYLKKPHRLTIGVVNKMIGGMDPLKPVEAFLKGTYIGGDNLDEILANDDALFSCESACVQLMLKKSAELKKN